MHTRFFTNHGEQTLLRKFQGVFESNSDIEWFDALVGFLRASGYFAIRPFLDKVPHIRILVGINVDAIMADYHRRGLLFLADPTKALEEFKNELRKDIQDAPYRNEQCHEYESGTTPRAGRPVGAGSGVPGAATPSAVACPSTARPT